ncbi:MAG: UDP-3-O-acyl-N-acetylglucosamine deacetylase [Candidatus Sumerlaeota bacterium]|nr:UDP-3-O-acyl-N-acetylglucosamine deacetylase [Candidatus Sumerlaeota bacterium]
MDYQKTLAGEIQYSGIGVHSGARVAVRLLPKPPDSGVVFVRKDMAGEPEIAAVVEHIAPETMMRQTTLCDPKRPDVQVATVEHLLAGLHGFGVDNCRVEIEGPEAPFQDGSAQELSEAIAAMGTVEQSAPRRYFQVSTPVAYGNGDVELVAAPADNLRLTFFLDYSGTMIGRQALSLVITPECFRTEIAPARTFCLRQEIDFLRQKGLIKGGTPDMALIVDGDRLVNPGQTLRFEDEFVRHKILDLLGDLYLLGRPIKGHIIAVKSGHASHAQFVALLKRQGGAPG